MPKTEIFGIDKKAADDDAKKKVKNAPQDTTPAKKKDAKRKTAFFGE